MSPGGFRAESRTVLGKAQVLRVEASQAFYCPGFIQPNKQTNNAERASCPGDFRAESKTVLGKAQVPRVEASLGFYCSGFIQPNKQTNKDDLQSVDHYQ